MTQTQKPSQALVQTTSGPLAIARWGMTEDQLSLLKRTICRGADDDEFALFMTVATRMGLDPFARQIHAVKRYDTALKRDVMAIQIGIDGYRLGAARTHEDDGQDGPYWCGADGAWHDVWISDSEPPVAAKVSVYRKGRTRPYVGIALWASYSQLNKDGELNAMWRRHGPGQLAKCAEALALRKAFPAELGGTNTDDELGRDAIDAEFVELKPLAGQPAQTTTSPNGHHASRGTPAPAAEPTHQNPIPADDKRPVLNEDDVIDIIETISRAGTVDALKAIASKRINGARMDDAQRARLERAYTTQLAETRAADAAAADTKAAP